MSGESRPRAQQRGADQRKGLALCLSASRLGFHVHAGFISALVSEFGFRPGHIAAASSGAFVGGLFAAGFSPQKIQEVLVAPDMMRCFWEWKGPLRGLAMLANLPGFTGFLTGKKILRHLQAHVEERQIEDCPHAELTLAVTNLTEKRTEILRRGPLAAGIVASCAVPVLFEGFPINGNLCWDGAVADSLPIYHLIDDPRVKKILAHVIVHRDEQPKKPHRPTISWALGQSHQIMTDRLLEICIENARLKGKIVTVLRSEVPTFRFWDRSVHKFLFESGSATARNNRALIEKILDSEANQGE